VSAMGEVNVVRPVLVRELIGETLREERALQGKTLREVSKAARVSLGYLSEVERGQKEASSELLAAICGALDVPLSVILSLVSEKLSIHEQAVDKQVVVTPLPVRTLARAAA
jgi:transcriptional regulator with XRE-family HTH domain